VQETLGFRNEANPWRKQNEKQKSGNSDDTQISRPDLRFASRENEPTQKGAGANTKKAYTKSWELPRTR